LRQLYGWLKPALVVPMHGEARHLRENARIAKACGVAEVRPIMNGDMLRIAPGKPEVVGQVPTGRVFRDGRLIVPDGDGPVRERRKLAAVGLIAVALLVGRKGEMIGEPIVEIDGVPDETGAGYPMQDHVLDAIEGTIKSMPPQRRRNVETLSEAVRRAVRSAVDETWGKKPIVKVMVMGGG
jgi:ribonuclease J